MFRLIIIALMMYGIFRLWKKMSAPRRAHEERRNVVVGGEMISCSKCGTYVMTNESIQRSGKIFCSEKCVGE